MCANKPTSTCRGPAAVCRLDFVNGRFKFAAAAAAAAAVERRRLYTGTS